MCHLTLIFTIPSIVPRFSPPFSPNALWATVILSSHPTLYLDNVLLKQNTLINSIRYPYSLKLTQVVCVSLFVMGVIEAISSEIIKKVVN